MSHFACYITNLFINSGHEQFMRQALALAEQNVASGEGGPFGAVIVKGGQLIAAGRNLVTSTGDPTAHAEVVAIRAACKAIGSFQLEGCEIFSSCEPCPMCLGAIYWARLQRIYFACSREDAARVNFDDSFIYDQVGLSPAERSIPGDRLLAAEGLRPFEAWVASQKKIPY